ncbi:cysteine-rich CWC family protein [Pseudomonas sp. UBA2684]|uniref:cysteine-rich CWC family protein n=1 Tax=Pseudomonas sp. UBA2684 TaxID=1947311 RepID=UPI000E922E02|nr:cysteine-rich CWC family protein [Pseudomonas sp. UBA2684]HBX55516.1 DNA or RNA helicase of superfamily II [Pseudomonas sp.]|tara:strand:+ start:4167 stop:4385 length:219 start_codon:yes stop_codon:yes gene_type:complete
MNTSASACPRCGQPNQCAQADASAPVEACWCFQACIERSVLDSLPAAQRNRACLCPRCAQGLPPTAADAPAG